jgi:hypothetical protein
LHALRDVPSDLGESPKLAVGIPDRRDHLVGKEQGSVLAETTTVNLDAPFTDSFIEVVVPRPRRLRWVERGVMFPDDLFTGIAHDPLGPAVPAHDVAGGVEHVDRIVADRFD